MTQLRTAAPRADEYANETAENGDLIDRCNAFIHETPDFIKKFDFIDAL